MEEYKKLDMNELHKKKSKIISMEEALKDIEPFKREYLCEWFKPSESYQEAYKLWLWYNYHCELYDSQICTGRNEYEDYIPTTSEEYKLINTNAYKNLQHIKSERKRLERENIFITEADWLEAKKELSKYKLKGLEEEYKHYFNEI
ncbi:MAG: hypothetical protein PHE29_12400 [Tissierellia bacterium]|nr:hypothetical protein [Tissierellia bacterium]MDD4779059.1 hypothetical protein [Tissierellia bacterium]